MTAAIQKLDQSATQAPSIPKVIVRAEPTLARILKTLDADYVKVQVRQRNVTMRIALVSSGNLTTTCCVITQKSTVRIYFVVKPEVPKRNCVLSVRVLYKNVTAILVSVCLVNSVTDIIENTERHKFTPYTCQNMRYLGMLK
jgi:Mediator complex subunit 24 N-terminal.